MHKPKMVMDTTGSSRVYNLSRKYYLDGIAEIKCTFCPYHRLENAHKYQRSWKKSRRNRWKVATNKGEQYGAV